MSMVWLLRIITNPYYKSVQLRYQLRESYPQAKSDGANGANGADGDSARYMVFTVV